LGWSSSPKGEEDGVGSRVGEVEGHVDVLVEGIVPGRVASLDL